MQCSFCCKEIECPKDILNAKKHMCHVCFQDKIEKSSYEDLKDVHVDYPTEDFIEETANRMVNKMIDEVFPKLWSERKNELKEMSKKDLAYDMFGTGAYIALSTLMKLLHQKEVKEQKEAKNT